ncbi:hypothetical protein V6N13_055169 [Hibiscus sabdariffa]
MGKSLKAKKVCCNISVFHGEVDKRLMACSSEGVSMVTSLKCWRKSMFPGRMVKGNVDKEGKFRLFNQSGMLLAWSLSLSSSCFQVLLLLVGELTGGEKQWSNPGCFCLSFEPGGAKTYIARQKLQIINLDFPLLLGTCPKTKGNLSNVEPPINFCKMFSSSLKVSGIANVIPPFCPFVGKLYA